ncbi:tripartite tricarboxylate transporter substrate binding protein [Pigmentiphaga soli]|uniref:Tripartite tricarboxylate transporter substrate binding protein n=1 Tax=Pigmentiphaga soli TaxID=1007095 RepID=A0ABP8HA35_9BURK
MRRFTRIALYAVYAAGCLSLAPAAVAADAWPGRPIRLVVPFAPGGGVDNVARALAARLTTGLGQSVVVENRIGAGGMIGTDYVAKADPDGYTLLMGTQTSLAVAPILTPSVPIDPRKAFAGAGLVASSPLLLVSNPGFAPRDVQQLIALAKQKPGEVNYGSGGIGTTPHMAGELLSLSAGIRMTHVAYKGEQPALTDVAGNQIPLMFSNLVAALPLVQSGKLRALAISTLQRSPALPDVPTVAESGVKGFDAATWFGVVAPKATPRAVVQRLGREIDAALKDPALRRTLESQGLAVQWKDPGEFDAYIAGEYEKWQRVIREAKISTQ